MEILHYRDESGVDVFAQWIAGLRDAQAAARIAARIERLAEGLFGDCKPLHDGVWELRIDWGPGYRIYYAQTGHHLILLLCGGDKRKQSTDTKRAVSYWREWRRRTR